MSDGGQRSAEPRPGLPVKRLDDGREGVVLRVHRAGDRTTDTLVRPGDVEVEAGWGVIVTPLRLFAERWSVQEPARMRAWAARRLRAARRALYETDVAARLRAAATSVCADPGCDLSGGQDHAGPCEPCPCPMRHAAVECLPAVLEGSCLAADGGPDDVVIAAGGARCLRCGRRGAIKDLARSRCAP